MKPLYWKFILILGAVIVGASLALPKALRKNTPVDGNTSHELVSQNVEDEALQSNSGARLSFHKVVKATAPVIQLCAQEKQCPLGSIVHPKKNGAGYLMLNTKVIIDNSNFKSASIGQQHQTNLPTVNFVLTDTGTRKFCEFTAKHIGKPFAILLDGEILAAPNINTAICGGRGFIEGDFTTQEAKDLARSLNAGTLPTKMRVVK